MEDYAALRVDEIEHPAIGMRRVFWSIRPPPHKHSQARLRRGLTVHLRNRRRGPIIHAFTRNEGKMRCGRSDDPSLRGKQRAFRCRRVWLGCLMDAFVIWKSSLALKSQTRSRNTITCEQRHVRWWIACERIDQLFSIKRQAFLLRQRRRALMCSLIELSKGSC